MGSGGRGVCVVGGRQFCSRQSAGSVVAPNVHPVPSQNQNGGWPGPRVVCVCVARKRARKVGGRSVVLVW